MAFGSQLYGHYRDKRTIDEKHTLLWEQIMHLI